MQDCNGNGVPDECDFADGTSDDCNSNGFPDECDLTLNDCNQDQIPDDCQLDGNDCNGNSVLDACDIEVTGDSEDINSNGIPDECECFASNYCTASPNSVGAGMNISHAGTLSVSLNNCILVASNGPPGQPGIFYYGPNQISVPFGDGTRCVGGQVFRLYPPSFVSNSTGAAYKALDYTSGPMASGPGMVYPGRVLNFQYWYRDPQGGPYGFNFSDAIELTFCP